MRTLGAGVLGRAGAAIGAVALVALLTVALAGPSGATHAGEAIQVSRTTGLADGDVVTVSFSNFTPADAGGKPVKIVIAGQGVLTTIPDKLNFEEYATTTEVPVAPDGTGVAEFVVFADHGTVNDGTTMDCTKQDCWIVAVQEPFLPQPNYATQQISFGAAPAPVAAPAAPAGPAAPVTTAPPATVAPETTVPAATVAPATTIAPTTTVATTTTVKERVEAAAASSVTGGGHGHGRRVRDHRGAGRAGGRGRLPGHPQEGLAPTDRLRPAPRRSRVVGALRGPRGPPFVRR